VAGSQAGEIVVENDDIEHPMKIVLDAPVGAPRLGEG